MPGRVFTHLPNLLSLSRIAVVPFLGYFLAQQTDRGTVICVILLGVAAVTDFFDGFVARRLHHVSRLGIAMDPIADKILAGSLVILLIIYRDFPLWLAAAIIGRDLLILVAGLLLLKKRQRIVPANLTGKYTFFAISMLLFSYLIEFPFGIRMSTYITVLLLIASFFNYLGVYRRLARTGSPGEFPDRTTYRVTRIAITVVVAAIYGYHLYGFLFG